MNKKFKKGTLLRCIKSSGAARGIVLDGVYEVESHEHGNLQLVGIVCSSGNWEHRFVEVEAPFNLSAPCFTAEGTPVQIVSTEGRDKKFPVLAYEGKATTLSKFSLDGKHSSGKARRQLTNVQNVVPEKEMYVNLYDGDGTDEKPLVGVRLYESHEAAEKGYQKSMSVNGATTSPRAGIAKVILVEGRLPKQVLKAIEKEAK